MYLHQVMSLKTVPHIIIILIQMCKLNCYFFKKLLMNAYKLLFFKQYNIQVHINKYVLYVNI